MAFENLHEEIAEKLLIFAVMLKYIIINFVELKCEAGHIQSYCLLNVRELHFLPSKNFGLDLLFKLSKHIHYLAEK